MYYTELVITMPKQEPVARAKVDRHVVVYDASFRRSEGEQCFYGAIKDNYGAAKLLVVAVVLLILCRSLLVHSLVVY